MPLPKELLDAMARQRQREHHDAERDKWWDYLRSALLCVAWLLVGLLLIGYALHTTDERIGRIAFWAGLLVGNGGMVTTLARAYLRGERRGDW